MHCRRHDRSNARRTVAGYIKIRGSVNWDALTLNSDVIVANSTRDPTLHAHYSLRGFSYFTMAEKHVMDMIKLIV